MLDNAVGLLRLFDDEMFDESGEFTEKVQTIATRVMGQSGDYSKPGNLKMNPEDLPDLVANYPELKAALASSPHAWMLTDKH